MQGAEPVARSLVGGDIAPARYVWDPYPTFDGIALDTENSRVWMSDSNRMGLVGYDRLAGVNTKGVARPLTQVRGPAAGMMFVAGVAVDPARREVYVVNNDIGDRMVTFPYDAEGNARPKRVLHVPHQAWALSLNRQRDEMAMTVQASGMIVVYRREASGEEKPLRVLRGPHTELADPHGLYFDAAHNEMIVANHGNWTSPEGRPGQFGEEPEDASAPRKGSPGGRFLPPSITVYPGEAEGDTAPARAIHGLLTQLDWPMGLDVDTVHNEIAVANSGQNSVVIFRRTDRGNVQPARVIRGPHTGIVGPVGVAIDLKNDEIWVANYSEHSAVVFPRTANGDVAPKRVLRNAPAGSPTVGFTNPGAVAYDSKRGQILVPN